jgi:AmiR/NasT family two-component response regulator
VQRSAESQLERLTAEVEQLRERTAQLQYALESRIVIEQAKGVLAERYRTDPDTAFDLLRHGARSEQMRIHLLARQVVSDARTPAPVARQLARLDGRPVTERQKGSA